MGRHMYNKHLHVAGRGEFSFNQGLNRRPFYWQQILKIKYSVLLQTPSVRNFCSSSDQKSHQSERVIHLQCIFNGQGKSCRIKLFIPGGFLYIPRR